MTKKIKAQNKQKIQTIAKIFFHISETDKASIEKLI